MLREGTNGLSTFDRLQTLTSQRRVGQRWHPGKRAVPGLPTPQHASAVAEAGVTFPGPLADPKGRYFGPRYRKATRGKRSREQRRVKTGTELARLEIESVNAAMTDWSYDSEVRITRSGNAVYRRPHSDGSASPTPAPSGIGPTPRMLTSMSVPSLQLKDQLVHLIDYDLIASELNMPTSLVRATAASLESRAPFENYEDDDRAVTGHVLDSSNRPTEPQSRMRQVVAVGASPSRSADLWEPELARRRAQLAADQHAADERWQAAAGPGSLHRAEVDAFRKTKLGLSGKLHGWQEQFKKEARWIASRKIMGRSSADDPEKRWTRIGEETAPRLPAWYHSAEQRSYRESRQMQCDDAEAAAEQAKLKPNLAPSQRRCNIEDTQRGFGVDGDVPGESVAGAREQDAVGVSEQSAAEAPGGNSSKEPTPEIVIAQKTQVLQQISPQEEHYAQAAVANPLATQMGTEAVAGAISIQGAPLPKFAGHHPTVRVDDMRDRIHFLFKQVDTDSNGALTKEELHHTLSKDGDVQKELVQLIHTSGRDLHHVFEQLDADGDHMITTTEFLALIEGTPTHPMAGGIDWENMDPMKAKPLAPVVIQKPMPVALQNSAADKSAVPPTSVQPVAMCVDNVAVPETNEQPDQTTANTFTQEGTLTAVARERDAEPPQPNDVDSKPDEQFKRQGQEHDATVAAVAASYTEQLISQGVEHALAAWPEEFTAASHPEQWSVFSSMDADGNGTLDSEELFFAMVSIIVPVAPEFMLA